MSQSKSRIQYCFDLAGAGESVAVREAMANASKHAQAETLVIHVEE